MQNALAILNFQNAAVRSLAIDGAPWWVAKDVCEVLGLTNPTMAVRKLADDEKGVIRIETLGGPQDMNIVNEPGLYMLICRCDKPIARPFLRWVTHEVLPTLRRTGAYAMPGSDMEARVARLEREMAMLTPKAALGLVDNSAQAWEALLAFTQTLTFVTLPHGRTGEAMLDGQPVAWMGEGYLDVSPYHPAVKAVMEPFGGVKRHRRTWAREGLLVRQGTGLTCRRRVADGRTRVMRFVAPAAS